MSRALKAFNVSMTPVKARILEGKLRGTRVGSFTIIRLLDSGKTAAVFEAESENGQVAVKIYDPDLLEELGLERELKRLEMQLRLREYPHPNIVECYEAGFDDAAKLLYLAMEYLPAQNLTVQLQKVPYEAINALVLQLVSAVRHLEELGMVHRDVKPDNILYLADEGKIKLADFGVIRVIGQAAGTDDDGRRFVGTAQYSPPEFLLRQEEDSMEGWRAISIYQIGAVLHDLIMRVPIFALEQYPPARLSNAVQTIMPEISNDRIDPRVINLAKSCLVKQPTMRLQLVGWDHFSTVLGHAQVASNRDRVLARVTQRAAAPTGDEGATRDDLEVELRRAVWTLLQSEARSMRADIAGFPPIVCLPDAARARFRFEIGQSRSFGIGEPLSILISLDVLDTESRVILLRFIAIVGKLTSWDLAITMPMFTGPVEREPVVQALHDVIFDCIDAAQNNRTTRDGDTIYLSIERLAK